MSGDSLSYIGPPELHDATVQRIEQEGSVVRVLLCGYEGQLIGAQFRGVTEVLAIAAEGMLLYGVTEIRTEGPQRRFVFSNWYDPGEEGVERRLELLADEVHFHLEGADVRAV